MGKTTCYHPVSLHIIRGSAEYTGFRFGKIRQLDSDFNQCWARYEAEIISIPSDLPENSMSRLQEELQLGFCEDVAIQWVHRTKTGKLVCQIDADLNRHTVTADEVIAGQDLGWLNDDPEDSTTIEGW